MQDPNDKIQRSLIKIALWTLVLLILLIGGGIFGYKSYRNWQERRLVAQANALVNEGNLKRASLDARRILQINPDSAAGCRIMARIAEAGGLRAAIDWRRRVVELEPGSAADLIALARTAFRFDDKGSLDFALKRLPAEAKTTADYHALAADLALSRANAAETEQHLREAVRLDPANKENALRLATIHLAANDPAVRDEGKRTLTGFQNEPVLRREATRRLLIDCLRRKALEEAIVYGRQLDGFPERTFADRLLLLSALHESADPQSAPMLQELQAAAAENGALVAELLTWFNMNRMPAAAIAWASQLPPELLSQRSVPVALSESYIAARDWVGMQRVVNSGNWGAVDFLRHALAARAHRELGNETEAGAQWNEAVKKVAANANQALTLAEIVQRWGWLDQAIELLWVASKDPATGDAALQSLYKHFAKTGATQDLYRVLLHRQEFRPDDRDVQNNVAQLSLLLNLNAEHGQKLARDVYEREPTNAIYASTYAFALLSAGDTKKALKIMTAFPEDQLRRPEVAAYYGLVLAAAGDHGRAAEYLDLGEKAGLLPEEKALVEKARRTLARR